MKRHIWVVQIDPVRHTFGHFSPGCLVGPDRFSTGLVEGVHSKGFDLFIAHEVQTLLDFDLNGQAVSVPATLSFDEETLHGLPAAYEILVGSSHDMVDARLTVGSRWAFKKDEWGTVSTRFN